MEAVVTVVVVTVAVVAAVVAAAAPSKRKSDCSESKELRGRWRAECGRF
jgi:hypothetical protein